MNTRVKERVSFGWRVNLGYDFTQPNPNPFFCEQVLLLDEVTVDMDVVGRLDLLAFFEEECAARGATILYATHIFDGLARWATHLALVEDGHLVRGVCPAPGAAGACALSPAPARTGLIWPPSIPRTKLRGLLACCVQTGSGRACSQTLQLLCQPVASLFVTDAALSAHSCLPIAMHVCAGGLSANS